MLSTLFNTVVCLKSQKFNQVYLYGSEIKMSDIVYSEVQRGSIKSIEIYQFIDYTKATILKNRGSASKGGSPSKGGSSKGGFPSRGGGQTTKTPPPEHYRMWSTSEQHTSYWNTFLLPPANEVWGKVIFSVACVKNSVHRGV